MNKRMHIKFSWPNDIMPKPNEEIFNIAIVRSGKMHTVLGYCGRNIWRQEPFDSLKIIVEGNRHIFLCVELGIFGFSIAVFKQQ